MSTIYGKADWLDDQAKLMQTREIESLAVSEKELSQISALSTPNEVLAVCPIKDLSAELIKAPKGLYLAADRIRDPGNLGTILRIADWFGCDGLILSEDCADPFNPKTVQASMGSLFRVQMQQIAIADWLKTNSDIPSIATVIEGENLYDSDLPESAVLLIGNESQGLNDELIKAADRKLSIPRYGAAESLNAAIATAVFCAEFRRRR